MYNLKKETIMANKQNTNDDVFKETEKILKANSEWRERFAKYADKILNIRDERIAFGRLFRTRNSLHIYSTTTQSETEFQIRFAGKKVGLINYDPQRKTKFQNEKVTLTVKDEQLKVAKALGYEGGTLNNVHWNNQEASAYRSFFNHQVSTKSICDIFMKAGLDAGKEARVENKLLVEFKNGELIRNINPVLLCGAFFQCSTPITASDHNKLPKYRGVRGGRIDILARIKHGSNRNGNRLAVIEVKDSHKDDTQADALQQAIAYATFLAYLLKDEKCGNAWWNIFGKGGTVPVNLHIDAVTLMPEYDKSVEGDMRLLNIPELRVTIHPYALYYKEDKDGNPTGFSGNLKDEIDKLNNLNTSDYTTKEIM